MTTNSKIELLASIATNINTQNSTYLVELKEKCSAGFKRDDFIWHYLLQSFSTMGNSSGWHGLIGDKDNYNQVTFDKLSELDEEARAAVVEKTCIAAKIRMPGKKASYILGCFKLVNELGGLLAAKKELMAAKGREGKIEFMRQFPGIGPKYARNIMMDVYHEDFRDSIAVDARIKSIASALGLTFNKYDEYESFFLSVAQTAGLNGWELDRLMYNYKSSFEEGIARSSS